jgi:hypothetical protein
LSLRRPTARRKRRIDIEMWSGKRFLRIHIV